MESSSFLVVSSCFSIFHIRAGKFWTGVWKLDETFHLTSSGISKKEDKMSMVEKKPSNAREHCTKCDLQTYDNGRDIDEKTCEKM